MRSLEDFDGQAVIDATGQQVGTVERTYGDQAGKTQMVEVSTGHLLGKKHRLVPVDGASVTDQGLQVPYTQQTIDNSPDASGASDALDSSLSEQVQAYYAAQSNQASDDGEAPPAGNGSVGTAEGTSNSKERQSMNTSSNVAPDQLMNYDLMDSQGKKVGSIDGVWTDPTSSNVAFVGVKTIPLVGKTYVTPADQAQIDSSNQTVTVPYSEDTIKNAPTCDPNSEITPSAINTIQTYYQQAQSQQGGSTTGTSAMPVTSSTGGNASGNTGNYPVDNLTYDLYTLISQKLKGLEAYAEYIKDAGSDQTTANVLRQLSQQDAQGVQQLQQVLVQRLTGQRNS